MLAPRLLGPDYIAVTPSQLDLAQQGSTGQLLERAVASASGGSRRSASILGSAVSIPANIAEGHGRELPGSFVQHLRIAQGSLKEVETLLMLIQRLDLVGQASVVPILDSCDELGRMLRAMIRTVQEKQ